MAVEPSEQVSEASDPTFSHTRDEFWEWQPRFVRRGWRRVVHRIGQAFMVAGVLVLLFVAYELWGTNFWTKRAQSRLRNEFQDKITQVTRAPTTTLPPSTAPRSTLPPEPELPDAMLLPAQGEALARLQIQKIGVDVIVVEGVDPGALRDGPGHYPGTPLPGQDGNVVVSGHRTTYGAPFHNIDKLAEGDTITVDTPSGSYQYRVKWTRVVAPQQVDVVDSTPGLRELTLTTCHPKFSASQRLIIRAEQVGEARPLS